MRPTQCLQKTQATCKAVLAVLEAALSWIPGIILNLSHCLGCSWQYALTEPKGRNHWRKEYYVLWPARVI